MTNVGLQQYLSTVPVLKGLLLEQVPAHTASLHKHQAASKGGGTHALTHLRLRLPDAALKLERAAVRDGHRAAVRAMRMHGPDPTTGSLQCHPPAAVFPSLSMRSLHLWQMYKRTRTASMWSKWVAMPTSSSWCCQVHPCHVATAQAHGSRSPPTPLGRV
jgi:hypothetical protein